MTGPHDPGVSAPAGWFMTEAGYRWWDGQAWGMLAPPPPVDDASSGRGLAILCHFGLLLGGFIIPLVLYLVEGPKNRFVRHHSREALNFNITFMIVWLFVFMPIWITILISSFGHSSPNGPPPTGVFLFFGGAMAVWAFALACSVVGAIRASQGVLWRYPICIRFVRSHEPSP